jgi:hypothetical protein
MKEIFEKLVAKAKEIENRCKKIPIETIHNNYIDEYYYLGNYYKLLEN